MFDRAQYKNTLASLLPSLSDEELEAMTDKMEAKQASVKKGTNVIHLEYDHWFLDDHDLHKIDSAVSGLSLKLSSFDTHGNMSAGLEEYMLQVFYHVNEDLANNIFLGLATNALWDGIKNIISFTWKKLSVRVPRKVSDPDRRAINFGLDLTIDKKTGNHIRLKLDLDASEETIIKSLDLVRDLTKTVAETEPGLNDFWIFDEQTGEWTIVDTMEEARKRVAKKNS